MRRRETMSRKGLTFQCFLLITLLLSGCATTQPANKPYKLTERGTIIWGEEFEFKTPPIEWKVVQVESGGEFGFGFLRRDPGPFPSQSMFVYDEEPFGCSTQFENREEEFFKRYLWSSAISLDMKILETQKVQLLGGEGQAVVAEGKDPIKKEKVQSKVVFGKRGDRVVAFYLTQWRPIDGTYDPSAFEVFDQFWGSFKYLKKSFYETL
jgi:hypothetical protein